VRLKVDVMVTYSTSAVIAAKEATAVIPIVSAIMGDPVGTGLVECRSPGLTTLQVLDLGPRQGARGPSTVHVSDQHRCLLLRSAKSMAARFQREHQWPAETVFSERSRLVGVLASPSQQSGPPAQ